MMKKRHFTALLFALALSVHLSAQTKRLTEATNYVYLSSLGILLFADSSVYSYNSDHRIAAINIYGLQDNVWVHQARRVNYTYNPEGKLLYFLIESLNSNTGQFDPVQQYTYQYDTAGRLVLEVVEHKSVDGWDPYTKVYAYDAAGNLISETYPDERYLFSYNDEGLLDTQLVQGYLNEAWVDNYRYVRSYTSGSNQLEKILTETSSSGNWEPRYQEVFSYDVDGNEVQVVKTEWNTIEWENESQILKEYGNNNRLISYQLNLWNDETWTNANRQRYEYDTDGDLVHERGEIWNNGFWAESGLSFLYYKLLSGTDAPLPISFQVFPNPGNDEVTLRGQQLKAACIFDTQGHLIRTVRFEEQAGTSLPTNGLPPGHYLIQAIDAQGNIGTQVLEVMR